MMRTPRLLILFAFPIFALALFSLSRNRADGVQLSQRNFAFAQKQLTLALERLGDSQNNPRSTNNDGTLQLVPSKDWTSGFFPGCLWLIYEYTGEEKWKIAAQKFTRNLEQEKLNGTTHDMGFKMFCSFGNGYRLTGDREYREILLESAKMLITRFNPKVGCIRSWDHHQHLWQYPVIIDNMMNLELLFWAAKESGDLTFYNVARQHAETTMKNQFRPDYSTWHVLNYDTATGQVLDRHTHQGYAHESTWARGQAWALYGFIMVYRETREQRFLNQAVHIANFILNHKNFPEDMVPYWDFDVPNIYNELRDASAAAILCSALYELSTHLDREGVNYKSAADKILANLSSEKYLAKPGKNANFLLMHAVGNKPANTEIDMPIIYADYYFLEANLRKLKIEKMADGMK
ncbi:glycoside hydrolase family 88 protein [candidate division KSB1 bacterium]|nr:glycoside hydrolase family 88 protein [candidate division KSB1 bacterium]